MITKLRILCVEDDRSLLGTLRMFLGVYNDFIGAERLSEARTLLNTTLPSFDVIILDKSLPDGQGFDLIPAIRKHSRQAAVIILTGDQDLTSVTKCLDAGADDYAVKSETLMPELMIRIPVARNSALMRSQLINGGKSQSLPQSAMAITPQNFAKYMDDAEKTYLSNALELVNWNYQDAVTVLGLARSTLFKKIADLGIQKPVMKAEKTIAQNAHWEPRL